MTTPKDIVRDGHDVVSFAYRGDALDTDGDPCYGDLVGLLLSHLDAGSRVLDLGCGCGIPVARDFVARHHHVTGVDISPVQIRRACTLVPSADFICSDMTSTVFPTAGFDAIISLYAIIHVPLEEQRGLFRLISTWLKPGGWLLCTVGHRMWTGTEENWLGVNGGTMSWSHADEDTYGEWLRDLDFQIVRKQFIPDGEGGHTAFLSRRGRRTE
ncbi:MAG: class I SAM-dependent methyltransferase [Lentisphaerae bacterium]|jgi:SAM-dependent methyltransferase|nr:class I SAM-dependent methyltransferase [Lentisphaerota bacterium]MBT4819917.1 class I SAM-dependent methyltransferase [Lentisphaerota bacterium]MBT5607982.1 class I SAM-dependent methyltransferase [Lentisphaerota bacterium]MBT7057509.1 class I SAM-dependent methyltransferase [Lentisphaerota bacterium]MBT7845655.1 class I SAM-dependent methyltransferase [Lentisphaerota bacterium]